MNDSEQAIRFAGSTLGTKRHICAFFSSPEEEYRVLLPFIKEGLERGEKAFHVVAPRLRDAHKRRLTAAGIDVEAAEKNGQLKLCDWDEAYFPDGRFDLDRMIAMWEKELAATLQKEGSLTRLVAHMEWGMEDREGVSDLIEYEAKCNFLWDGCKNPVICTYDLTKYSAPFIIDVLRTHPMVIVGGILQQNPFYVQPQQFVQELRQRRAASGSQPSAN
jgi:MEDS: MEthanogen/methylotroph, DcmR Sensory domain